MALDAGRQGDAFCQGRTEIMHEAVGRTQTVGCGMDPGRAAALHQILGRTGAPPADGEPLPPFFHQVYFWDVQPPEALGRDGHPETSSASNLAPRAQPPNESLVTNSCKHLIIGVLVRSPKPPLAGGG